MKLTFRFLLCFIPLLVALSALGQTTSSMTGDVTAGGTALPGVSVTVSSPALQGTRTAVTGSGGGYNFSGLPPGQYTVAFELEGMQKVTKKVTLSLAQTSRVDADLKVSGVAEAITVTASAASVLETTQLASNFTSKQLAILPVSRTITSAVLLAPGVSANGVNNQITISGAPSYDNVFLVNGVVVNENLRGQPHNLFIEDAIQETTVLTGGISAEYGRFTGGVVSTLTKSGGNQFSGSFRDSLANPKWTAKTPFPTEKAHVDKTDAVYEATLGGFVLKDRLWFFGAGRSAKRAVQKFTAFTNLQYANSFDEKRREGKLTGQITPKHGLIASYLDVKNNEANNAFGSILDFDSIVPSRSLPNSLLALNYHGVITTNFLVEGQYSKKKFKFVNSGGRFTDRIRGTWIQDAVRGARYNAPVFCGVCTNEERNNKSYLLKGMYYLTTSSMGSHSIAVGGEDFAETRIANNYQSASQYQITGATTYLVNSKPFPRFDSNTLITWRPVFDLSKGTDFKTDSAFVNDKWDFNSHFGFNIGLRFDKNNGHDASGNLVSNDKAFSPRLGLNYDLHGDGRQRLNVNLARYVAKIADGNVGGSAQAAGNPSLLQFRYKGPVINPAGTPDAELLTPQQALAKLFAWFDSVGGNDNKEFLIQTFIQGLGTRFDKPIKSPAVNEVTFGYGLQVGRGGFVKADLIGRNWKNFYAAKLLPSTGQSLDRFGNKGDVSVTINDNSIKRTYRGAQLQASWRGDRINVGGGYTYSKLRGNDQGEGSGTATVRNLPLALYYPEYLGYPQRLPSGYLSQDQRHRIRAWAGYDLPTPVGTFNLSLLQAFDSGRPYGAVGSIDASGRVNPFTGLPANPGYTLSQLGTTHDYYFTNRDAFRTDNITRTDFALNYSLPVWKAQLFAKAALLNAFAQHAVESPNTDVITRRTGGASSGLVAFNPMTETPTLGTNYKFGPDFGKATGPDSYQLARTYNFSLGLRF